MMMMMILNSRIGYQKNISVIVEKRGKKNENENEKDNRPK